MPTMNQGSIWQTEPVAVIAAAVIAVVNGGLQVLAAFGVVVTAAQATSIGVFVTAVIALAALLMRSQVVPLNAPDGPDRLVRARLAAQGSPMGGTGSSSARSPYRVPAPAFADALAPTVTGWRYAPGLVLMVAFGLVAFLSCTPGEIQIAHGAIVIGGQVCEDVLTASDPALAPLCVTAEEVALAIAGLIEDQKAAARASGKVGSDLEHQPAPSRDAIYQRVVQNRAAKKGAAK